MLSGSSWFSTSLAFDGEAIRPDLWFPRIVLCENRHRFRADAVAGAWLQVIVFSQRRLVFSQKAFGLAERAEQMLQLLHAVLSQPGFDFLLGLIPKRAAALNQIAAISRERDAGLAMVVAGGGLD